MHQADSECFRGDSSNKCPPLHTRVLDMPIDNAKHRYIRGPFVHLHARRSPSQLKVPNLTTYHPDEDQVGKSLGMIGASLQKLELNVIVAE